MKKQYYLYTIIILASTVILPSIMKAEQGSDVPLTVLQRLRANTGNIETNKEIRNQLLGNGKMGSTTKREIKDIRSDLKGDLKDIRRENKEDMKDATSSVERREIKTEMHIDIFAARKDALVKELRVILDNLKQIRQRVSSRIDKAITEGRNMTEAKKLLVIADGKITLAEQTIITLNNFQPTMTASSTSIASSTIKIKLDKPREVGEVAKQTIKQAHEALVATVRAIAHAMGLGNATSTSTI